MIRPMRSTITRAQQQQRNEAITQLRAILKPGDTVYAIVRNVAKSGMSRKMSFFAVNLDAKERPLVSITTRIAAAVGWRTCQYHGHWAITVGGCGMDMVFHVVSTLASVIYANDMDKGAPLAPIPDSLVTRPRLYWLNSEQL